MRETTPAIRLISRPSIDWEAMQEALHSFGADDYAARKDNERTHQSDAELLIEYGGRRCYKSWEPGLNANVTKVREDPVAYLGNIIKSGHGSVLEHAQFTFDFDNVSRVFTAEMCRHRAGVAISQESLRYVRLTDLGVRIPTILEPMRESVISIVEHLEEFQREAAQEFGLDDDGVPFHYKKEVTSALRRLAPMGVSTGMVWSANLRTLRHVIAMRTSLGAEEEIRFVFDKVAEIMANECPAIFADFTRSSDGVWTPEYDKV